MSDHVRSVSSLGRTPAKSRIAYAALQSAGAALSRLRASAGVKMSIASRCFGLSNSTLVKGFESSMPWRTAKEKAGFIVRTLKAAMAGVKVDNHSERTAGVSSVSMSVL